MQKSNFETEKLECPHYTGLRNQCIYPDTMNYSFRFHNFDQKQTNTQTVSQTDRQTNKNKNKNKTKTKTATKQP